jgi:hypothetical protein
MGELWTSPEEQRQFWNHFRQLAGLPELQDDSKASPSDRGESALLSYGQPRRGLPLVTAAKFSVVSQTQERKDAKPPQRQYLCEIL